MKFFDLPGLVFAFEKIQVRPLFGVVMMFHKITYIVIVEVMMIDG